MKKIDLGILEEAKRRAGCAVQSVPEAVTDPFEPQQQKEAEPSAYLSEKPANPMLTKQVVTANPPCNRYGSFLTYDPVTEFERHLGLVFELVSAPEFPEKVESSKAALLFDFNHWLEVNIKHDADFGSGKKISSPTCQKTLLTQIAKLQKRYAAQGLTPVKDPLRPVAEPKNINIVDIDLSDDPFMVRLRHLYFYLWYTVLGIQVERLNEFSHFVTMMEDSCCSIQLENVSICIQVLGGHEADDRETFLGKLRPHFQKHLARVSANPVTCYCSEGLK